MNNVCGAPVVRNAHDSPSPLSAVFRVSAAAWGIGCAISVWKTVSPFASSTFKSKGSLKNARVYHAYDGKKPKSSVSSMATMAKMQ